MFSEETSQGHTWLQWACLSRMDSFSMMCSLKGFSSKVFNLTLNVSIPSTNALWIWQLCDILDINTWSSSLWGHCLVSLWCHNHGLKICGLFWKLCVCIDCMHAARHVSHRSGSTVLGLCRFSPGAAAFSHRHAVRRVRWLVIINWLQAWMQVWGMPFCLCWPSDWWSASGVPHLSSYGSLGRLQSLPKFILYLDCYLRSTL